nr:hypothetical protein [Candidatus Woesebacteria bacterium]
PIGGSTAQISQQSARAQTQPAEQLGETRSEEVAETQEADTLETTGEQEVVSLTLVPETMTAESESNEPEVLAQVAAPTGTIRRAPLFSPLQLTQAVGLAVTLLILSVLVYDAAVAYSKKVVRFTSKNTAHICLFLAVSFVLLFFKSGIIQ